MPGPAALIALAARLGIKKAATYGKKELTKLIAKKTKKDERAIFKKTKPYFKNKRAEKSKPKVDSGAGIKESSRNGK